MPTNRMRRTRKARPTVEAVEIHYLKTGDHSADDGFLLFRCEEDWHVLWEQLRDTIMAEWIRNHPGTRPWAWWGFDAPRQPDQGSGGFWEGTLPEPRQRVSGTGTPKYEVLAYVPHFTFGIPDSWISKFDEDYYNGRSKDIHGNKVGNYQEGDFNGQAIDPKDPPRYESQADYLKRHGLLSATEEKALAHRPDLWEPEMVRPDDNLMP